MLVVNEIDNVKEMVSHWKKDGESVGLVPTMGYLHEGHLSLVKACKAQCNRTVVSIFVNPSQFAPNEDLAQYPRDLKKDSELLAKEGVDLVFAPEEEEMYFSDYCTYVEVEGLSQTLIGEHRPTHLRGVTSVCSKLFNIVQPERAFFGQKDFQQVVVIRRMVRDLNFPLAIVMMPIVREADGLALSSRNMYLTPSQRQQALILSQSVKQAEAMVAAGTRESGKVINTVRQMIEAAGPDLEIKYITIVDAEALRPVAEIKKGNVLLIEVYVGKTRLYDNTIL